MLVHSLKMDIGTPNCDALYQVVKAEAGPKTSDSKIECLVCTAPFAARNDEFVLKYFPVAESESQKMDVAKACPLSGHARASRIIAKLHRRQCNKT